MSRVGLVGLALVAALVAGCSSDDDAVAKVGTDGNAVDASTTSPDDSASDGGGESEDDSGEAHTFIFPTTAQVVEAFGSDYALTSGGECTATFAKGVQGCEWQRNPPAVADGVHSFRVSCDFRLPAKADPAPKDWVDEIVAIGDGATEVDSLPVPGVYRSTGGDSAETSGVDLSSVFVVEGQKPFTVCSMVAAPIWDDAMKAWKNVGLDDAKAGLMKLAEAAIQPI